MIYRDSSLVQWESEFRPLFKRPKDVRAALNACVRGDFETESGWLVELIRGVHSLDYLVSGVSILSSCKRFVASPAYAGSAGHILAVEVRRVITDSAEEWKKSPAFADAAKRHRDENYSRYEN